MTAVRLAAPALLALAMGACGGGGGSGNPAPPAPVVDQAPVARISASSELGFAPLTVTLEGGSSTDADGTITAYRWDLGDGGVTATGPSVSHTFSDVGAFTVTLEVTDDDGLTGTAARTIRVQGASVAGVIQIAPGSAIDSDVNDRLTVPVSNNSFGSAQPLVDPARLGGFVNVPGTGAPDGNFFDSGDVEDIFAVKLQGDETIVLSIGDPSADLDLQLYSNDPEPVLLDASVSADPGNDATEDLRAPAEGQYFVRVEAIAGASNYVLRINDDTEATALRRRAKRLTDPFVPGEVLVTGSRRAPVKRYGIQPAHAGNGLRLQSLHPGGAAAPDVEPADARLRDLTLPDLELPAGAAVDAAMAARYRTLLAARHLSGHHRVPVAEVNVLRQPHRVPSDVRYGEQWHYPAIQLEQAWDLTTGQGSTPAVVVAVVDTGVLLDHPDLQNKLLRNGTGQIVGYDFIQDPARANDGDGLDPNPADPGDDEYGPGQGSFHGTHVAGTVAAETDNGIGVAGVSWGARIMPLRVLGIDGGTTFDVMQAVRYAAGLSNVSGSTPPVRADIVNLSLGSDFYSEAEQQSLNEVRAQGVILVASAGNGASSMPSYPAAYDGVMAVSATNRLGTATSYSNFGPHVDVAAPGGELPDWVLSTLGSGGGETIQHTYDGLIGTSMAAPHVSGVIALMKSLHPALSPGLLDDLLHSGNLTNDAGASGRDDTYGWGIVNAHKAVLAAQQANGGQLGPIISVSVSTLNFQGFTRQLEFSVTNVGDEPTVVSVSENVPWLAVAPAQPSADGFGLYRATVDRSGLSEGRYTTTIDIRAENSEEVSPVRVQVIMEVTAPDPNADAGQHYVILTDPDQEESLAVQIVTATSGQYTFTLEDVAPGDYRLFAGTDLDNDDFICDGGEACGAYPTLTSPEIIHIDPARQPDIDNLTFASEFRTTATTTTSGDRPAGQDDQGISMTRSAGTGPGKPL